MMPIDDLRAILVRAFPNGEIHLTSPMNDNNHFNLVVVAPEFEGINMVEQHQLIYKALGDAMKEAVHALSIKTYTPELWKKTNAGNG